MPPAKSATSPSMSVLATYPPSIGTFDGALTRLRRMCALLDEDGEVSLDTHNPGQTSAVVAPNLVGTSDKERDWQHREAAGLGPERQAVSGRATAPSSLQSGPRFTVAATGGC